MIGHATSEATRGLAPTSPAPTLGSVSPSSVPALESLPPAGILESPAALVPAQVSVEGGSTPVVLAALVTFFVATVLAVLVTYRFVEGYRRTRARPIMWLAVGMFLLAPGPMFIRLLAGNVAAVPLEAQLLLGTVSELCGLLVVLYAVYST